MSIRRFGRQPADHRRSDSSRLGARDGRRFPRRAVHARCNVLISGGTGSGKTTLLNCLSRYIPQKKRIITIEDAAELAASAAARRAP
jgi:pilus assembly protein CpaF